MAATAIAPPIPTRRMWSAVGSMAMCAAMLIASEIMPVSLLTPIATDLHSSVGTAGQAISISGLFAVFTSLFIGPLAGRLDRRSVLMGLAVILLLSLALIAGAVDFKMLMIARALLGAAVGGFWSLATATIMRLVPEDAIPKALGVLYTGNAIATAFAAPIGSYLGGIFGWRGVFWSIIPIVAVNLVWQLISLPSMPAERARPVSHVLHLLQRKHVAVGMLAVSLTFAGAFSIFTYLRPFLETYTHADVVELSTLLLGLGLAGFLGTYGAGAAIRTHLYSLLRHLPLALGAITAAMLALRHSLWGVAATMVGWGAVNAAIPVSWSTWLTQGIKDEPESGGSLMVAAIQLSIMAGAEFGGQLLDRVSIPAALWGGISLLVAACFVAGDGKRLQPQSGLKQPS
jgi:predicted MFS family arabinose efflux permease